MSLRDEVRQAVKSFDPAKHPRDPKGTGTGGQFTSQQASPVVTCRRQPQLAGRPMRAGKPVPVQTKTLYHVTTPEAAQSILRDGFDLSRVKPRWQNDYAVSTSVGLKPAVQYFMQRKNGKPDPTTFGNRAVLRVKVKGHFYDRDQDGEMMATSAQGYTQRMVRAGWDAANVGGNQYIYNPQAIFEISLVDPAEYQ